MEDSIFMKIIKGEIPCHKIYEDDKTFVFLDNNPVQPGHTLVISKKQVEFVWDLDDESYRAVMDTAKKVANRMREVLDKPYVGEQIVGIEVPHAHVHVIPFSTIEELRSPGAGKPSDDEMAEMAEKLKF